MSSSRLGRNGVHACLIGFALLGLFVQPLLAHTSVSAGSAGPWAKNSAATSNAWKWQTPTPAWVITWTSGDNEADGALFPLLLYGPETKFRMAPLPIAGKTYTGFSRTDTGPLGSTAETSGEGRSLVTSGVLFGKNYYANWLIVATGNKVGSGSWRAQAAAFDPFTLTSAGLLDAGVTGPDYDLYLATALESASHAGAGAIAHRVLYETGTGTAELLRIWIDASDVEVSGTVPPGSRFYLLDSLDEGPTEDPAELTNLASIRASLQADVAVDGTLDTPLYLGIVVENLPVPTIDLGDGSVARIRVESAVGDGEGGMPSPIVNVRADSTRVFWSPDPAAGTYDVVYGNLGLLRASGGDFTVSLTGCVEDGSPDVSVDHAGVTPGVGAGIYYLVRSVSEFGFDGTYGSPAMDAMIAASPVSCP